MSTNVCFDDHMGPTEQQDWSECQINGVDKVKKCEFYIEKKISMMECDENLDRCDDLGFLFAERA